MKACALPRISELGFEDLTRTASEQISDGGFRDRFFLRCFLQLLNCWPQRQSMPQNIGFGSDLGFIAKDFLLGPEHFKKDMQMQLAPAVQSSDATV